MNEAMLFAKEISVDAKGRVFLPAKNTGVKPGEKLYLFYSEDHSSVIVRSEKSIQSLGQKYINADPREREEKLLLEIEENKTTYMEQPSNKKSIGLALEEIYTGKVIVK